MYQEDKVNQRSEALVASLVVLLSILGISWLLQSTFVLVGLLVVASLPFWLPYLVVRIRFRIFGLVNGHSGIELPSKKYGAAQFKHLYNHPSSGGRSKMKSFGLSDVFWYFLAPSHEVHQEHVENWSPKYKVVSEVTKKIILRPREVLEEIGRRYMNELMEQLHERCDGQNGMTFVYLRDLFFPMFAKVHYELAFPQDPEVPPHVLKIITAYNKDVIEALKFCKLRNLDTRNRMTNYLKERVKKGDCDHIFGDPSQCILSEQERAWYLQGVIFNTGLVQMSEAMAHVTLALAQHKRARQKLVEEIKKHNGDTTSMVYLNWFLQETLRVYPLFGVAHRITTDPIPVTFDDGTTETLPEGSVLVFSHPAYQRLGFNRPNDFIPERWKTLKEYQCNFIPFGVKNNRPCPGRFASWYWMREMTVILLQNFEMFSSVEHTRSIPDGGKCVLKSVGGKPSLQQDAYQFGLLTWMWGLHKAQSVWMSLAQFGFGLYMLIDAKRQKLCLTYFDGGKHMEGYPTKEKDVAQQCPAC